MNPTLKILLYSHSREDTEVGVYAVEAEYHMDIHKQFCFLKHKSPCSTATVLGPKSKESIY